MRFGDVRRLREFQRDLKRLTKRYPTLEHDLETLIDTLLFLHHKINPHPEVRRISDLGPTTLPIFKVRRFACRSLRGKGGRTGLRLIHAWDAGSDAITLIEIYIKSDKDNEDRTRILSHFSEPDA
jgi:hypothetical protein